MSNKLDYIKPRINSNWQDIFSPISQIKSLKKGTFLFSEGDIANELYVVKNGKIKVGKITDDGRELSLRMCKKNDVVGELALYEENTRHFLHAKVFQDSKVAVISKTDLEKILLSNSELTIEFIKLMSTLRRRDQTLFRDLILYGKKGALYSTLIRLTNSYGKEQEDGVLLTISLTNQELADFCGTTRESVNRLLSELRKKGIISMRNGYMLIHDLSYLKRIINCEDCPVQLCTIH